MTQASKDLDVCISIVSGNDPAITLKCLQSIVDSLSDELRTEIHFIDNASPLDWFERVPESHSPSSKIIVHRNAVRKGFGANHNSVISTVDAQYYLLVNDDTFVHHGCVEKLVAAAKASPSVGFVGPKLLNPDGSIQHSVYRFPSPMLALVDTMMLHRLGKLVPSFDDYRTFDYETPKLVDYLSGAALLIKREVCNQVGIFDECFFMYSEETDWAMRAHQEGWQCLFIPDAKVMHYGGHSTVQFRPARSVEFLRSHEKLIRKHFGTYGLFQYKFINLIKHLPRLVAGKILNWPDHRQLSESDTVLWSLGLLNRPGLSELAKEHSAQ